jgi:valyl-tRNA synthetase
MDDRQAADETGQLPSKIEWAEVETALIQHWVDTKAGAGGGPAGAPHYSVAMPPPNVTGQLHMGHALNMTIQDLMTRLKRKQGFDVLWLPGCDHASIATHYVVERLLAKEGKTRFGIGREEFLKRADLWKAEASGAIQRQIRRLGCIPDWDRERFTLDPGMTRAVMRVFVTLHRKGLAYRGLRLVNWDPQFRTAISDLEVETREVQGSLWYINYPLSDEPGRFLTVATTRPETLFGDQAVAVNPGDPRYADLIGRSLDLPLTGRRIPIIADAHADPEQGSGAVKITPAHDFNDYEVGLRHGLAPLDVMTPDAKLNDQVPPDFRGLDRFEARTRVVAALEAAGFLARTEPKLIAQPFGDRSGVPVEPRLTQQWFIDVEAAARQAAAAVADGRTVFAPPSWAQVYFRWLDGIKPWCVSRQLWYGHRIPAWYGPDGQVFVEEDEAEALQAARRHYGTGTVTLTREEDVFDTWFSSGLWPFATLGWPEAGADLARYYPTNLLVTGFDIIFFWVARMMMQGLEFTGEVPFGTVYIHGLVRDGHGQKMSKTKGNVIDPLELVDEFGADATRLALMSLCGLGQDIRFSKDAVRAARLFITKLWNAARFARLNGARAGAEFRPDRVALDLNRWIIQELVAAGIETVAAMETYRFSDACIGIQAFVRDRFCDWYLEFAKVVLAEGDTADARETRQTAGWCIATICHLLNPVTPFITETLWGYFGDGTAITTAPLPDLGALGAALTPVPGIPGVIALISRIRSVRTELGVPAAARVPLVLLDGDETVAPYRGQIQRLAMLSDITRAETPPAGTVRLHVGGLGVGLVLDGIIDFAQERLRLEKARAKAVDSLAKVEAQLADEPFVRNAAPEAVEKVRQRRQASLDDIERIGIALGHLA